MQKQSKGNYGENQALLFLAKKGYSLIEKNFHSRFGEIDLIMRNETYIIFVEVKLRKENAGYLPREAVTYKKQEKCKLTAEAFLAETKLQLQPRFDVIEVYTRGEKVIKIEHIINAF